MLSLNYAKCIGRQSIGFIRRRGYAPPDAQDLTQSFFAFFLRTKAYARTDKLHGKFRSFLLASVKNFLADNWDREQAIRRSRDYQFVSLDQKTAEAFYDITSACYDPDWRLGSSPGSIPSRDHCNDSASSHTSASA
jgi:DNA-directed RNA polymerase specialized sigma24 family protein